LAFFFCGSKWMGSYVQQNVQVPGEKNDK